MINEQDFTKNTSQTIINNGKDMLEYGETPDGLIMANRYVYTKDYGHGDFRLASQSFYKDGKLLAEIKLKSANLKPLDEVVIYSKNSFAKKFEGLLKDYQPTNDHNINMENIAFSDKVIEFPGQEKLVEDFKNTFKRHNNANELNEYAEKIPPYILRDEPSDIPIYTVEASYVGKAIEEQIDKVFASNPDIREMMDFIDRRPIIDEIMREMKEGIDECLDEAVEGPTQASLATTLQIEIAKEYLYDKAILPKLEYAVFFTIPTLIKEMDAPYDIDRATRVTYLKEDNDPLTNPLNDRMEAINNWMADEAYEYAGGEREVYHMRDLVQYISNAVDTLERRALVSQNHNKENSPIVLSTNELIVLTLLGNPNEYFKKHHDSMEDLTKDYQNFRDTFLPELKNVANYIPSENEPEEVSIMKYTKDYALVFTSGKALFKTDFFKEPCNTFCKGVTDKMKEKAELNDFIKTGKLPAQGKTAQR